MFGYPQYTNSQGLTKVPRNRFKKKDFHSSRSFETLQGLCYVHGQVFSRVFLKIPVLHAALFLALYNHTMPLDEKSFLTSCILPPPPSRGIVKSALISGEIFFWNFPQVFLMRWSDRSLRNKGEGLIGETQPINPSPIWGGGGIISALRCLFPHSIPFPIFAYAIPLASGITFPTFPKLVELLFPHSPS